MAAEQQVDDVPFSLVQVFLQVNYANVQTVEHLSHFNSFVLRHFVNCSVTLLVR